MGMEWCKLGEVDWKNANAAQTIGKTMATIFWDPKGILLIRYMPKGSTITTATYSKIPFNDCNTIKSKL